MFNDLDKMTIAIGLTGGAEVDVAALVSLSAGYGSEV